MFKAAGRAGGNGEGRNTKAIGDDAESLALAYLQRQGLVLVQRNYRVALGPHARGAEVDLILRERDGTLIFVEVRSRAGASHGGALASVGATKQRRSTTCCDCRCFRPAASTWWPSTVPNSAG
jgi:putative endonuclease